MFGFRTAYLLDGMGAIRGLQVVVVVQRAHQTTDERGYLIFHLFLNLKIEQGCGDRLVVNPASCGICHRLAISIESRTRTLSCSHSRGVVPELWKRVTFIIQALLPRRHLLAYDSIECDCKTDTLSTKCHFLSF